MMSTLTLAPHEVGARVILRPVEPPPEPSPSLPGHWQVSGNVTANWEGLVERLRKTCPYGQPGEVVLCAWHDRLKRLREAERTIASVRVARLGELSDDEARTTYPNEWGDWHPEQVVWIIEWAHIELEA